VVDGRVVDLDALHVEVLGIICVQHARGDIRNVLSSV